MEKYLNQEEYAALQQRLRDGQANVDISRSIAWQFFVRVPSRSIQDATGRSLRLKKSVMLGSILIIGGILLVSLGLIIGNFGWGAALGVPLAGIFWTVVAGFTPDRGNQVQGGAIFLFVMVIAWLVPSDYGLPLALLATSLMIQRLSHVLAQFWVIELVSESFSAYDMMVEHINIVEAT